MRSAWLAGGVGAYGADVCALCGELGFFRGWIAAVYGCYYGPHREFVCKTCWVGIVPKAVTEMVEQHRLLSAALSDSEARYCRLCQVQIERHPKWGSKRVAPIPRLCAACLAKLRERGISEPQRISDWLRERCRRRYLELLDDRQLDQMSKLVDAMRKELDSQRASDDESDGELSGYIGIYPQPRGLVEPYAPLLPELDPSGDSGSAGRSAVARPRSHGLGGDL